MTGLITTQPVTLCVTDFLVSLLVSRFEMNSNIDLPGCGRVMVHKTVRKKINTHPTLKITQNPNKCNWPLFFRNKHFKPYQRNSKYDHRTLLKIQLDLKVSPSVLQIILPFAALSHRIGRKASIFRNIFYLKLVQQLFPFSHRVQWKRFQD